MLTRPDKMKLHTLLGNYPNVMALKDGRVKSDLIEWDFPDFPVPNRGFKPMVREHKFDCGELAIVTFLQAREYGLPYVLLPATVLGRGQLHTVAYNSERGAMKPSDLNGKKFGVRSYTQTTGIWVRGILAERLRRRLVEGGDHHHGGPARRAIQGPVVRQARAGDQAAAADADRRRGRRGADRRQVPRSALQDAGAGRREPPARNGREKHGGVPINHMVIVREKIAKERPDVVEEIFRVFKAARDADTAAPKGALDPYRFGVEANREALERIIDYSVKQQMITEEGHGRRPVRRRDAQAGVSDARVSPRCVAPCCAARDACAAGRRAGRDAANFPNRPIRIVVPFPAGGPTDVNMRIIGQKLSEIWGQGVVIENRPGANTGIGAQAGRERAAPTATRCSPPWTRRW